MIDESDVAGEIYRLRRLGTDDARVEVKAAVRGLPKSVPETLSAFANGSGGMLILGLDEEQGFAPAEGFDPARISDALAGACADAVEPPVRSEISIMEVDGAAVVALEVPPLDPLLRPCVVRTRGAYNGSFIRGGDGDRRLTSYEVSQLLSNQGQPDDDAAVVDAATAADLDEQRVSQLLERLRGRPNRAFTEVDDTTALVMAGVLARDAKEQLRPTLAGLLCLGRYPQQFFPQLFISFVALPGKEIGDSLDDGTRFLDNVTCDGSVPDMLHEVLAAARRNMRTAAVITGGGREDRHDYPIEVIRELVVNAVLHRDYSPLARGTQVQVELYPDRLVVKSPGTLFGAVVPSQLGVEHVSSTRNAVLAKLLADIPDAAGLPVSENRGSGLPRVMSRLRRAGMSPPDFEVAPSHVHVSVPQHALLDPPTVAWIEGLGENGLSDDQHIALAIMRQRGTASNEILRAWGVDSHVATLALRDLVQRGLVSKYGGRRYATYELTAPPVAGPTNQNLGDATASSGERSRRIEGELLAVVEAVRAGCVTANAISAQLSLTYATVNRRLKALERDGRLERAQVRSRAIHYAVPIRGSDGGRSAGQ